MKLSTKIAYNTIIQIISKIISIVLGILAIAIMTRYLGKYGFGQYTTIIAFLMFFSSLADFGLTLVTLQLLGLETDNKKTLNNLFAFRLISILILLGTAIIIAFLLPYDTVVKQGIVIASLSYVFVALNQILVGVFQKNLRMDKVAIAEIVSKIILFLGVYWAYFFDKGIFGVLFAMVISNLINFLMHYIFSLQFERIRLEFDFSYWKIIFKKSWPLALTIFFNLIYLKTDTLILSLIKSQNEVGIYGAAYKIIDVLVTIPFMFAGLILPILTSAWAKQDKVFFDKVLQKSFDVTLLVALPILVGSYFTANQIMRLIAGNEFAVSGPVLKILMIAASLIFFGCLFSHSLIALDKQKKIIWAYVFVALSSLVLYLIFIPKYSYFGAAWVTVYSEGAIALASLLVTWKYSRFLPNLKILPASLFSVFLMAVFLYFSNQTLNIILLISISALIYTLALYATGAIKKEDVLDLIKIKSDE